MMVKSIATLIAILFALISKAQELTYSDVKHATFKVAKLIEANYVLKEKGAEIAKYVLQDFKEGRFSSAKNWKELDSIMTQSLKEISNDGHLYAWNNLEIAKQLQKEKSTQEDDNPEDESETFFNDQKAINSNYGFSEVKILDNNVGYIKLSQINISQHSLKTLYATMEMVKNTRALIIDLRGNGGGGSTIGPVLETYFFKKEVELLEFKTRDGKTEITKTVPWLLEKRYVNPVYILIDKGTASAAEAFAFSLKQHERAIIVGEPSAGAAFMNTYFLINEFFVLAVSTAAPFLPNSDITWEQEGVQPDVITEGENTKEKALELISKDLEKG